MGHGKNGASPAAPHLHPVKECAQVSFLAARGWRRRLGQHPAQIDGKKALEWPDGTVKSLTSLYGNVAAFCGRRRPPMITLGKCLFIKGSFCG